MDNKIFQEKWMALQPKIKQKWSKFSDQELQQIKGDKNKFISELQKKYGIDRNMAEQQINAMAEMLMSTAGSSSKPQGQNPYQKGNEQKKGSEQNRSHSAKH